MASPDLHEGLTRGKAAEIMMETDVFPRTDYAINPFCDIVNIRNIKYSKLETPYYYDILVLNKLQLFSGVKAPDGSLYAYPQQYLTREQAALMVTKAFSIEYKGIEIAEPKDINDVSEYAKSSVMICLENKIIGLKDDNFYPKQPITKYEFIQMFDMIFSKCDINSIKTSLNQKNLADDVRMYISDLKDGYVRKNYSFNLIIENNSDKDYVFGDKFQLEVFKDGKWKSIPVMMDIDGIGNICSSGSSNEEVIKLGKYIDNLEEGHYRIIRILDTTRQNFFESYSSIYCICEFDLQ